MTSLFFTVASYAAPGLQAVLELYFSTFLYVCSKHAVRLASTSINVYIAVYQICALPGGYLADRVLGKQKKHRCFFKTLNLPHRLEEIFFHR